MCDDWFSTSRWLDSPRHVAAAAVAVVNPDQQLLLVKSPLRGWELPGGQVELGESVRDAAVREVREESGIDIELLTFSGIFQNVSKGILVFVFSAKPVGGFLRTSPESVEVGWYPLPTALDLVPRATMRQRIQMAVGDGATPFLVEHVANRVEP